MPPSAALVAALLAFASAISGLPVPPGAEPKITLSETARDGRPLGIHPVPEAGMTYWDDGGIYLYAGWRGTEEDNCTLAHELAHYLQVRAVNRPVSIVEIERQAYRVTLACLKAYRRPRSEIAWAERMVRDPHIAR